MTSLCLVFDLDDTLYPEHEYVRSGFRAVSDWVAAELGLDGLEARLLRHFEDGRRGDIFDRVLMESLGAADPALIARLVEVYRGHSPSLRLFEDAAWALTHYAERAELALITDGWLKVQQAKVAGLGIAPWFRELVFTDAYGRAYWKPHTRAFQAVEQAIPGAARYIYVADNEAKDFVAPNARGWLTVKVAREGAEYRASAAPEGGAPQAIITSLRALPDVLGA